MYGQWAAKKTPIAIKVETAEQLVREWNWPTDTLIHNKECECTNLGRHGKFKVVWCGDYVGSDWYTQRRISYRCNGCHKIVTFMDRTDSEGRLIGDLERQVIIP